MKKLFFLIGLLPLTLQAQVNRFVHGFEVWTQASYHNFQQTSDGGYIISTDAVPEMDSVNNIEWGYLIRLDDQGNTTWIKRFPKTDNHIKPIDGNPVYQAADAGFIVGATRHYQSAQSSALLSAIELIKTDPSGNVQWSYDYPGLGISQCFCVRQTSDLGYIFCGTTTDTVTNEESGYIVKTDASGNVQWGKAIRDVPVGSPGILYAAAQAPDGGYICCGHGANGTMIIRLDASGNITWSRQTPAIFSPDLFDVINTADNNFLFTGSAIDSADGTKGIHLLKIDNSGNNLWSNLYVSPTTSYDVGYTVCETVSGYTIGAYVDYFIDATLLHTDLNGNIIWTNGHKQFWSVNTSMVVDATIDGGYAFMSGLYTYDKQHIGCQVTKTDSTGYAGCLDTAITMLRRNFNLPVPVSTTVQNASNRLLYPVTMNPYVLNDTLFCSFTGPEGTGEQEPGPLSLVAYPNPGTAFLNLEISAAIPAEAILTICDAQGRKTAELPVSLYPGKTSLQIETASYPAGMYLIRIFCPEGIDSSCKYIKAD